MSGIAGIIHFDGAPVEPGLIEKMTSAMAHRGPDGIHHWVKGSVAVGQCMLRTTPESLEETQPLANEDESLILVMDGRVDNWEELRAELLGRGAVLRTRADAELVLRAYEAWGKDCLTHIDGDFAMMIWDARRREAFCARDRMGNKPFNYHWNGKTFVFASELHTILDLPWVQQEPNGGMLAEFLADELYSRDETAWNGILRLIAAHRLTVDRSGFQIASYWKPDLSERFEFKKEEEYFEYYRWIFADSVRRVSRSHRPVAIEVSGGLDSSAVFCMAENLRRKDNLPAPNIKGFTVAFKEEDGPAFELNYARIVGEYLGLQIHEIPPSMLPLQWFIERACFYREFPGHPNGVSSVGLLNQAAAQGCRVILTGEEADLWLTGSRMYYAEELIQRHWRAIYRCFKSDRTIFSTKQAMKWLVRYGIFPLFPLAIQEQLRRIVHGQKAGDIPFRNQLYWLSPQMQKEIERRRKDTYIPIPLNQSIFIGQINLLKDLYHAFLVHISEDAERLYARSGIEIRHPFNNTRFVQYAFSTPERLRLRGDRTKYIHICALKDLMPRTILERKSKAEFSILFRRFLDHMEELFTKILPQKRADWMDPQGIKRLYRFYLSNPQASQPCWILWNIYIFDKMLYF